MDDEETKNKTSEEIGKLGKILHNKSKLHSLRSYQGDVAEFIKEKNESVISIAIKEKEKEEETKKKEAAQQSTSSSEVNKESFRTNLIIIFLSLILVIGGSTGLYYAFKILKKKTPDKVIVKEEIIPYSNLIKITNVTGTTLESKLAKLPPSSGLNILEISGKDGRLLEGAKNFFNSLEISLPPSLGRTLKDRYAVGVIFQNDKILPFLIISTDDFGRAFSAMLDWEENMPQDLSFLNIEKRDSIVTDAATSTIITTAANTQIVHDSKTSTTTVSVNIPMKAEIFNWKDVIIKNKDTRAFVNSKNQAKIAYTFLDKNTILIVGDTSIITEILSAYAPKSVAR